MKLNLLKVLLLGTCMSTLTTGTAFAQMAVSTPPSTGVETESEESKALYAKQTEVDQYIFTDHAKELADKGITVNYTGVGEEYIEIGISPYTDENVNYLYDALGKDLIKIVDYDESVMYATSVVADPGAVLEGGAGTVSTETTTSDFTTSDNTDAYTSEVAPDKDELNVTGAITDASSGDEQTANDGKVYKDAEVQPQEESAGQAIDQSVVGEDDAIFYTTADNAAPESTDAVKRGAEETSEGVSATLMILVIAGGAAVIGSAVIISKKKKNIK